MIDENCEDMAGADAGTPEKLVACIGDLLANSLRANMLPADVIDAEV